MFRQSAILHVGFCLVFFALCSAEETGCETVESFVETAFFLNVGQQQRGADDKILRPFFRNSVSVIITRVLTRHLNVTQVGSVCIDDEDRAALYSISGFGSEVQLTSDSGMEEVFERTTKKYPKNLTFSTRNVLAPPTDMLQDLNVMYNLTIPSGFALNDTFRRSLFDESFVLMGVGSAIKGIERLTSSPSFAGNVFYLPVSSVADNQLESMDHGTEVVMSVWNEIQLALSQAPSLLLVDSIAQLPQTLDLFYDPQAEDVNMTFFRQKAAGNHIAADRLLFKVTAMVLQLHVAGVPYENSVKLLRHVVGFLFNGMRSTRKEGKNLVVSTIFMPFYDDVYRRLLEEVGAENTVPISEESVETVYGNDLAPLLLFSSHGKLEYDKWELGLLKRVNIENILFDNTKLWLVRTEETVRILKNKKRSKSQSALTTEVTLRSDDDCSEQYVSHDISGSSVCCALFCAELDLILTVGITSMDECCAQCNSNSCPTNGGQPLAGIMTIVVQSYGYYFNVTTLIV